MGTRADFYLGKGENAQWLGSIAWDGYPDGIDEAILKSKTKEHYIKKLRIFFSERDDVTLPRDGWPWPWEDSNTTDYAYAFDKAKVSASCFGSNWFDPLKQDDEGNYSKTNEPAIFPNMEKIKNVKY